MFNGKTRNGVDITRTRFMPEKRNSRSYVIVANASTAYIFEKNGRGSTPVILKTLENSLLTGDFYRHIIGELSSLAADVRKFVLVASPSVLGPLRQQLKKGKLRAAEILGVPKDISKLPPKAISGRLDSILEG
jgi:hypothetical protein